MVRSAGIAHGTVQEESGFPHPSRRRTFARSVLTCTPDMITMDQDGQHAGQADDFGQCQHSKLSFFILVF